MDTLSSSSVTTTVKPICWRAPTTAGTVASPTVAKVGYCDTRCRWLTGRWLVGWSYVFLPLLPSFSAQEKSGFLLCNAIGMSDIIATEEIFLPRDARVCIAQTVLSQDVTWNSLPLETRACSPLLTFRRETKSHLFRQSYGWRGAFYSDGQQTSALSCATVLNLDFC